MKRTLGIFILLLTGVLVGAAGTSYIQTIYDESKEKEIRNYIMKSRAFDAKIKMRELAWIRDNDISSALDQLELDLNSLILRLKTHDDFDNETNMAVFDALGMAKEYREEHPFVTGNPELDNPVTEKLKETEKPPNKAL